MNKLKYAVILLLGLSMAASCTKDPNNGGNGGGGVNNGGGNNYSDLIVGKWEAANTVGYFSIREGERFSFLSDGLTTFPFEVAVEYEIVSTSVEYERHSNPGDLPPYPDYLEFYADYFGITTTDLENGYWVLVGNDYTDDFFILKLTSSSLILMVENEQLVLNRIQ